MTNPMHNLLAIRVSGFITSLNAVGWDVVYARPEGQMGVFKAIKDGKLVEWRMPAYYLLADQFAEIWAKVVTRLEQVEADRTISAAEMLKIEGLGELIKEENGE